MAKAKPEGTPTSQRTVGMPNKTQLTKLLASCRTASKEIATLNGESRENIAQAVENQHLHKKAFAEMRRLDKMEPEQMLEYETHRKFYMDALGFTARMEQAARMPLGDEPGEKEGQVGGEPANVANLDDARGGERKVAAAAH